MKNSLFFLVCLSCPSSIFAHELTQRIGGSSMASGESRVMGQLFGRAEAPKLLEGELQASLKMNASVEKFRYRNDTASDYVKENFDGEQKVDRSFGIDGEAVLSKRSEISVGGGLAGDGVTKVQSLRASIGRWLLGDQLRVGANGTVIETRRPPSHFLDFDARTVELKPLVVTRAAGVSLKAIVNPTTILSGDYTQVQSTERPRLYAWSGGVKQFIPQVEGAIHGEVARVINVGDLDTNMSSGELTGLQGTISYLQTLTSRTHGRISYRYAREDEFTRAYEDHLLFGSDSYTAALSHEVTGTAIFGRERPVLYDVAVTRYIDNQGGSATTFETAAGVKF